MFLVCDGSSLLVTCYYAILPKSLLFEKDPVKQAALYPKIMQTSDGVYTNGIFGMMRTILKILKEQKPDYMAIVFDQTRDTFRRRLFAEYKGNRKPTPDPLKQQFILAEQIFSEIGIKTLYSEEFEADDLAGSIIHRFEGPDVPMAFMTKDHDYLQLCSAYTRGWMIQPSEAKLAALCEKYLSFWGVDYKDLNLPDNVFEFFPHTVALEDGVWPSMIPDLKGIVGDTSDNIPGVKGVSSAAAPLLLEYGSLENLYDVIDSCATEKNEKALASFWKDSMGISRSPIKQLKNGRESAFLSKQLATIRRDAPVPEIIEDYRCVIDQERLHEWLVKLEFNSLI